MTYKEIEELLPKYDIAELCCALTVDTQTLIKEMEERGYTNIYDFYNKTGFDFHNINIVSGSEFMESKYSIIHFKSEDIYVRVGWNGYWDQIGTKLEKIDGKFVKMNDITQVYPRKITTTIYTTTP